MTTPAAAAHATYEPGSWVVCAGSDVWLLAGVDPGAPVVQQCWAELSQGSGIDGAAFALVREGTAVRGFALLGPGQNGSRRLLLSGLVRAEAPDSDPDVLRPGGGQIWTEHAVDAAAAIRLVAEEGAESPARLPLMTGVALARVVEINPAGAAAAVA
jgi:hypothetical protein